MNGAVDEIEAALVAFEAALSPETPADMPSFVQQRVRLARSVNAFLAGERERLNDLTLLGLEAAGTATQEAVYKELVALRLSYSGHIARWDNRTLAAAWTSYYRDCLALISGMRRLLATRQRALQPRAA